jgi:putative ABC transport system ATP-binding protein
VTSTAIGQPATRHAPTDTTTVLSLDRVWRVHGSGHVAVEALREASLHVDAGELVAVMGPSGSGKSTLLTLAGGLDRPTRGEVTVLGQQLSRLGAEGLATLRRRTIGYVFQELNLLPGLTAAENVSLPLELDGTRTGPARDAALGALASVGLEALADRFPEDLSGGEQQRVAIAAALSNTPAILLADEPTAELDSESAARVLDAFRAVNHEFNVTVIMVTHDLMAARRADRRIRVRDGRVLHEGVPIDPISDDGRVLLPDEAVAALGGVDLEAEVDADEVRLRRRSETGHA